MMSTCCKDTYHGCFDSHPISIGWLVCTHVMDIELRILLIF